MTPTARTLKHLRDEGWTCQVVEKFNPFAKVRIDLFGIIDILAVKRGEGILGVQATSDETGGNSSSRIAKCKDEPRLTEWLASGGRFQVWAWRTLKQGKRDLWFPKQWDFMLLGGELKITQLEITGG